MAKLQHQYAQTDWNLCSITGGVRGSSAALCVSEKASDG